MSVIVQSGRRNPRIVHLTPRQFRRSDNEEKMMKTLTDTIERKGYVATAADIEHLAEAQCNHVDQSRHVLPSTYLRALIATTQSSLGYKNINRAPPKPTDEEINVELEALTKTHEVFYAAVQKGAARAQYSAEDARDKAAIISSRVVFARSSYSSLRNWILRGRFTLRGLNPRTATKRMLYESTPRTQRAAGTPAPALRRQAERMVDRIKERAETDREGALYALQEIIVALSHGFDELGLPGSDIREAIETSVAHETHGKTMGAHQVSRLLAESARPVPAPTQKVEVRPRRAA